MRKTCFGGRVRSGRDSAGTVAVAAFIAALFLSLLCSTLYNVWNYDVVRYQTEEGNYHARLTGVIEDETLQLIRSYANVESARVNEKETEGEEIAVDILLKDVSSVYEDLPRIASLAGLREENISYHQDLLNLYFVVNPNNPDSQDAYMILMVFAAAGFLSCFSLIIIIRHAYAVQMDDKIRQLGILASVGATPAQIRNLLLKKAFFHSAAPAMLGTVLGIAGSAGLMAGINAYSNQVIEGRMEVPFSYHPLVFGTTLLCVVLTVLLSAWIPARRLSRLTPLEAIRGAGEKGLKRRRKSRILGRLFGVEGELAGNALKARRKTLRMSAFSLTLSFLAFGLVQCLLSIMTLNTELTYFDAFRNSWDVMVTVKDTNIEEFERTDTVQILPGVRDALVYQKASAKRILTEEELSGEFLEAGGFADTPGAYVLEMDGGWLVNAPIFILDDASFLEYCARVGAEPSLEGAVILNQVRDDTDPNFRLRTSFPYVKEDHASVTLRRAGEEDVGVEIPVLGYTQELPVMREEYQTLDYYEMIHVLPVSLWAEIGGQVGGTEENTLIRVLAGEEKENAYTEIPEEEGPTQEELDSLEKELVRAIGSGYETETENRIEDRNASDGAIYVFRTILGGFCVLLAMIGIGSVFSNTLSFARQRRRETARYLSVGMTPAQIWKMFCVEALVIACRPVLISLPILLAAVLFFMKMAYLDPALILPRMPVLPIVFFALAVFAFVGLAYYLGGKRLMRMNLADMLRDERIE